MNSLEKGLFYGPRMEGKQELWLAIAAFAEDMESSDLSQSHKLTAAYMLAHKLKRLKDDIDRANTSENTSRSFDGGVVVSLRDSRSNGSARPSGS